MRSIQSNSNVPPTKGPAELGHNKQNELNNVRDGAASDAQGLSEEEESRILQDANERRVDLVQVHSIPHHPSHVPVVQWERFLPLRSLKVLLVESDDATRHLVSALLRNCSYEVRAVKNGLEAWKVLIDPTEHFDLVLTEVVMPYLSGVGLLSKIVSHITCKNIPVIMMSSDDSMGIVFNCLSKGAVDFLVKPIRKNELKNLWQHVWRKCHSSSGSGDQGDSGSESGIGTQRCTKSRSIEESKNDAGNNDDDENRSIGLTAKDGSDKGSGTQGSCLRRAVEIDSSHEKSSDQSQEPPDSTCAQLAHARPETFCNYWAPMNATQEVAREEDELESVAMGKDLEIGVPRNPGLNLEDSRKHVMRKAHASKEKILGSEPKEEGEILELRIAEPTKTADDKVMTKAADLMGTISKRIALHLETMNKEVPVDISKHVNKKDKTLYCTKELPALELCLKRPRDGGDAETSTQIRNVIRHSGLSAFSRYNTRSSSNQAPTDNVGSCSPADHSSEAAKHVSTQNLKSNSNGTPNQRSNGNSNDDMGSTTNNGFASPEVLGDDKSMPKSADNINPCVNSQAIEQCRTASPQPVIPNVNIVSAQPTVPREQVQVRHHHHHYHHHHHHVLSLPQQQQMANHMDGSLGNMVSNVLTASTQGNAINYQSASGSNGKSNGEDGSSGLPGATKMDNGVTGKYQGSASGSGSGKGSAVDQNRLAQREAALNKFREKKKARCFEKKVRYQSRKQLAEQRPRVRGQFVRRGVNENKNEDAKS